MLSESTKAKIWEEEQGMIEDGQAWRCSCARFNYRERPRCTRCDRPNPSLAKYQEAWNEANTAVYGPVLADSPWIAKVEL